MNSGSNPHSEPELEKDLREVAERMAEAQQLAQFGNWEWVPGVERVVWSEQLYRIFGLESGEYEPTFEGYLERIHPEDRQWVRERIEATMAGGEPYLHEHRIVLPDGSTRTLRCHGQAVLGEGGEVVRMVGVCQDVSQLAEAEGARRVAESRFRTAFEHAPIGKALVELERDEAIVIECNKALCAITGYRQDDLLTESFDGIAAEQDRYLDRELRDRLLAHEIESYAVEKRLRHKSGHQIWCQLSVSLAPGGHGEAPYGIVHVQDISERRRFEQRLRYLADHDSLTGLINRRRFRSEIEQLVSLIERYGGQGAVLVIDIDNFKLVNDTLGHHTGDNLLRRTAEILRERVRTTDIVARLSGDEFAVLMPQVDRAGALQLAEDLRSAIADRAMAEEQGDPVTVSIGVSMYGSERRAGAEAVLVAADLAMYRAKEDGRDRIALFEDSGEPVSHRDRGQSTSAKLRDALSHDRLTLYAQPILDLGTREVLRHELLLRMVGNGGEPLPAAAFIETAERVGMVQELDRWVVVRALRLMSEQQRAGDPWAVHINVSGASVTDLSVLEYIERQLDEGDADPRLLTFEITETAAIRNFETATAFADRLGEFGCQVAIDDYGAGFGPFYYLKHLPFDLIKIDGDFVRDLPRSDADQLTVQAIVQIAHGLGKRTIAEFVQDDRTAELLHAYGVDMAQGFHLGMPEPLAKARR